MADNSIPSDTTNRIFLVAKLRTMIVKRPSYTFGLVDIPCKYLKKLLICYLYQLRSNCGFRNLSVSGPLHTPPSSTVPYLIRATRKSTLRIKVFNFCCFNHCMISRVVMFSLDDANIAVIFSILTL